MTHRDKEQETLGERLRKRREALGFSPDQIVRDIQVNARYLYGLEEDNYEVFPAKVYAQGFLKKLLVILSLPEPENLIKEFNAEWDVRMFRNKREFTALPTNRDTHLYLTPQRLGMILGGGALLAILLVSGIRLTNFMTSPTISIKEPLDKIAVPGPLVRIKGKVEKESLLTVNGRELKIDGIGNFNEEIELAAGLNALEFLVKDRFGKESKMVRYVLVK
ncbi:MAG: helix-turn-helix domain-containing protein [Candidatus Sungbacteria bacterium]|nr:helix-turn-helix domain-containing protein [Candidatus Sungbacteria bacterium]